MLKKFLFSLITFIGVIVAVELVMKLAGIVLVQPQIYANQIADDDKDSFRILTLGESTTADYFAEGENISWPRGLEKSLREQGFNVRVYNEGISGVTSVHLLRKLNENIDMYKPDLIIAMMGINDSKHMYYTDEIPILERLMNLQILKLINWISATMNPKAPNIENGNMTIEDSVLFQETLQKIKQESNIDKASLESTLAKVRAKSQFIETLYWHFLPPTPHLSSREELQKSNDIARLAMKNYPENRGSVGIAVQALLYNHLKRKCFELGISALKEKIELSKDTVARIGYCLDINDKKSIAELEKYSPHLKVGLKYKADLHYKVLYEKVHGKGVNLILMQYPTKSLESLKEFFQGSDYEKESLAFISNEENFKQALQEFGYDKVFIDKFAVTWGHATKLGNDLIIKNVSNFLIKNKYLENK